MKKIMKTITAILLSIFLICDMTNITAFAVASGKVIENYTEDDKVVLYVSGIESEVQEISYQIGNNICEIVDYQTIGQNNEPIYSLIIWDNSVSVMKKNEAIIKEILLDIVANRASGEKFSIITLEKDITVLSDYTNDYAVLKQSINSVEQDNKTVYIIENLYNCLENLNNMEGCDFKRVILISDGAGEAGTGYTKTELESLLKEHNFPIYSIGVGDDEEGLQYLFSLSRTTGADAFHVDKLDNSMEVSEGIREQYNTLKVVAKIPEELLDGSSKNSKLTVTDKSGNYEVQCQVKLPFLSEIPIKEPTEMPKVSETPILEPTEQPDATIGLTEGPQLTDNPELTEKIEDTISFIEIIIMAGILMVVILSIVIIYVVINKKKKIRKESKVLERKVDSDETAILYQDETQSLYGNDETEMLVKDGVSHRFQLVSVSDAAVMYRCNISTEKVKIGRRVGSCNIVLEDKTVSSEHCEIYVRNGRIYIRDSGSSNGTFVDGRRITDEVELRTGSILKLGKMEYRVMIG